MRGQGTNLLRPRATLARLVPSCDPHDRSDLSSGSPASVRLHFLPPCWWVAMGNSRPQAAVGFSHTMDTAAHVATSIIEVVDVFWYALLKSAATSASFIAILSTDPECRNYFV